MKALTLRLQWAWMGVNGYKDIENRSWPTKERGRVWIHASSSKVTKAEYEEFLEKCRRHRITKYPEQGDFNIGGIVGSVEITKCVSESKSKWFYVGGFGFVLKYAKQTRFKPMKGKLNFWEP